MALDDKPFNHWAGKMKEWLVPQIFEIGRTKAVHLASPSVERLRNWVGNNYSDDRVLQAEKTPCDGSWEECKNIEPIWPSRALSLDHPWAVLFMVFFGLLLFTLANRRVNESLHAALGASSPKRSRAWAMIGQVIAVISVVAIILLWVHGRMQDSLANGIGKPFVWLEGINIWLSLVVRFGCLWLYLHSATYF